MCQGRDRHVIRRLERFVVNVSSCIHVRILMYKSCLLYLQVTHTHTHSHTHTHTHTHLLTLFCRMLAHISHSSTLPVAACGNRRCKQTTEISCLSNIHWSGIYLPFSTQTFPLLHRTRRLPTPVSPMWEADLQH